MAAHFLKEPAMSAPTIGAAVKPVGHVIYALRTTCLSLRVLVNSLVREAITPVRG